MSLHQHKMSKGSIEHAAPNSGQHAHDVSHNAALKARKREVLLYREADNPGIAANKSPCIGGMDNGWQYALVDGKLFKVLGKDFIRIQNEIRSKRCFYFGKRYDKKLGRERIIKRKIKPDAVLDQYAQTISPVHGAVLKRIHNHFLNQNDIKSARHFSFDVLNEVARSLAAEFERITERIVTGVGVHLDTFVPHFHIQNTRITEDHELTGDKGQGTSGSQFTIYRDLQFGLVAKGSEKYNDFCRNMRRYEERKGSLPTDILLTAYVDKLFPELLKKHLPDQSGIIDKMIQEETEIYRQKRLENERKAIEDKERELIQDLETLREEKARRNQIGKCASLPSEIVIDRPAPENDVPMP